MGIIKNSDNCEIRCSFPPFSTIFLLGHLPLLFPYLPPFPLIPPHFPPFSLVPPPPISPHFPSSPPPDFTPFSRIAPPIFQRFVPIFPFPLIFDRPFRHLGIPGAGTLEAWP